MIKPFLEGIALLIVIMVLFNTMTQFLQTLHLFDDNSAEIILIICCLLALLNLLSDDFFGLKILRKSTD